MRKNYFLFILLCAFFNLKAQITVTDNTHSVQQLVEQVLVNSTCAQTSNYSSFTGTAQGFNGIGYFERNSADFPFESGIVLSTGKAIDAIGPNETDLSSGNAAWAGDTDLQTITGTTSTFNASYIQFDFVPLANTMSFDFIFASEEYMPNFQCKFSDVFAFILTDSHGVSRNLAVIPGTNTPIKVTTVHGALTEGDCQEPINEEYFDTYNDPILSATNYNGQTVPLTASAEVIPGETYTIKLVIADDIDWNFDSAVFLAAGSFNITGSLGEDRTIANGNPLCNGETLVLDTGTDGSGTYEWKRNGIVLSSETASTLTVTQPGTYQVNFTLGNGCQGSDEIIIEYTGGPTLATLPEIVQCEADSDGKEWFDLSDVTSDLTSDSSVTVAFYESAADVTAQTPIANTTNYQNKTNPQTLIVEATSEYGCKSYTNITLRVATFPRINFSPSSLVVCDSDFDGIAMFDLTSKENEIINGQNNVALSYFTTRDGAAENDSSKQIINSVSYTNTTAFSETIYVRAEAQTTNCFYILPLQLQVNLPPKATLQEQYFVCLDEYNMPISGNTVLDTGLQNTDYTFEWYNGAQVNANNLIVGATESTYQTSITGHYTVRVIDNVSLCEKTFTTEIIPAYPAQDFNAVVTSKAFSGSQVIEATVTGNGSYVFSLNGGAPQESGIFTNVPPGEHVVTVSDTQGCSSQSITVMVIDFQRFFTPNGDGVNDYWDIFKGLDVPDDAIVYIFDKFGKLLKQLTKHTKGWDGTFNGISLPSSDYWFSIVYTEDNVKKEIKGHFTLKR